MADQQNNFGRRRFGNLTNAMRSYNQQSNDHFNIHQILPAIENALNNGQNISKLPTSNPLRYIYDKDMALQKERADTVRADLERSHQRFLRCQAGQATVLPPRPLPSRTAQAATGFPPGAQPGVPGMMPGMAPPGGMPGAGLPGLPMPGTMPGAAQGTPGQGRAVGRQSGLGQTSRDATGRRQSMPQGSRSGARRGAG